MLVDTIKSRFGTGHVISPPFNGGVVTYTTHALKDVCVHTRLTTGIPPSEKVCYVSVMFPWSCVSVSFCWMLLLFGLHWFTQVPSTSCFHTSPLSFLSLPPPPNVVGGSFHNFGRQGHGRGGVASLSPQPSTSRKKKYEEEISQLTEQIKEKERLIVSLSSQHIYDLLMCVCVCVCVWEREREREREWINLLM